MILFLTEEAEEQVLTESVISELEKAIKTLLSKLASATDFINLGYKFLESVSENVLRIVKRQVALAQGLVERTKKDFGSFIQSQNLLANHSADLQDKNLAEDSSPVGQKYKQMAKSVKGGYFIYIRNCFTDFKAANVPEALLEFTKFVAASIIAVVIAAGILSALFGHSAILLIGTVTLATLLIVSITDTYFRKSAVEKGVGKEYSVFGLIFDIVNMFNGVSVARTALTVAVNFFVSYMFTSSAAANKGKADNTAVMFGANFAFKRLISAMI